MKKAIIALFSSKKFIVFLSTNVFLMLTMVFGLENEHATFLIEKGYNLAMVYLGTQGAVDVGLALRGTKQPVIDVVAVEKGEGK